MYTVYMHIYIYEIDEHVLPQVYLDADCGNVALPSFTFLHFKVFLEDIKKYF